MLVYTTKYLMFSSKLESIFNINYVFLDQPNLGPEIQY